MLLLPLDPATLQTYRDTDKYPPIRHILIVMSAQQFMSYIKDDDIGGLIERVRTTIFSDVVRSTSYLVLFTVLFWRCSLCCLMRIYLDESIFISLYPRLTFPHNRHACSKVRLAYPGFSITFLLWGLKKYITNEINRGNRYHLPLKSIRDVDNYIGRLYIRHEGSIRWRHVSTSVG